MSHTSTNSDNLKCLNSLASSKELNNIIDTQKYFEDDQNSSLKKTSCKKTWTHQENLELEDLYEQFGPSWTKIARNLPNRTAKQIREHYLNVLDDSIMKGNWSSQEDKEIKQLIRNFGTKWSFIASVLNGRTENQVKNRYYLRLKQSMKTEQQSESCSDSEAENDKQYQFKLQSKKIHKPLQRVMTRSSKGNKVSTPLKELPGRRCQIKFIENGNIIYDVSNFCNHFVPKLSMSMESLDGVRFVY